MAGRLRVLVTGFEAFGGDRSNPTEDLVKRLNAGAINVPAGIEVQGHVLRVGFESAFDDLSEHLDNFNPDVVLAFGVAGGRTKIEFERIAINMIDADIPDNDGLQPRDSLIIEGGENALFSTLPIRDLQERLQAEGIPSAISNSAGLFVCNYLFYRMQDELKRKLEVRSGFIHVPKTTDLPAATLGRALELVLESVSL